MKWEDRKEYYKVYYETNKEKIIKKAHKWNLANRDKHNLNLMSSYYKRKYGISKEEFLILCNEQNNKCKICNVDLVFGGVSVNNKAVMDHCHSTGRNRGVLCNSCNTALGKFKDNIQILESAILYLRKSKNDNVGEPDVN